MEKYMEETISKRLNALIEEGKRLEPTIGDDLIVRRDKASECQAWIASSINLIETIAIPNSGYHKDIERTHQHEHWKHGVPRPVFQQVLGILISAQQEWEQGLLRKIEYIIVAEAFDDFLDHAAKFHRGNKITESAVLAAVVLEDTTKKIARKNGIDPSGKSLDELIDELSKTGVITPVKAKRFKGFSGVRNSALHAEWDQIDVKDVGELIKGIREMIEQYL
jgi:uncharacterized protein YutE (UPF0331/DUF86 family)